MRPLLNSSFIFIGIGKIIYDTLSSEERERGLLHSDEIIYSLKIPSYKVANEEVVKER